LGGFGIGDANARNLEASLEVPRGIGVAYAQSRLRDESQTSPLEIRTQLENFRHGSQCSTIALPRNDTSVLVFHLGFAGVQLSQQHQDGLQDVEGLKA